MRKLYPNILGFPIEQGIILGKVANMISSCPIVSTFLGLSITEWGSLLSAISLLLGALTALWTALKITSQHNLAQQRNWEEEKKKRIAETFRSLHQAFWENEDVVFVRRCIINNVEYDNNLREVLILRNKFTVNNLTKNDNDIIEKIDRYCGTVLRIKSFLDDEYIGEKQAKLWRKLLWQYWHDRIKNDRYDLYIYISNHWGSELLDLPDAFGRK